MESTVETRTDNFGLLRTNRNFALLWIAEFVSSLGDRVHQVAMAALVYRLTGSLTQTGIAFIATALPDLLLGPVAGVLVDRWDRRRVLIACDLMRIAPVLLIPFVAHINIWLVYGLLFWVNALSVTFRPARRAIIPAVVERPNYHSANSLTSVSENASDVIGYPLAGGLLAVLTLTIGTETGLIVAFGFDALTYLISASLMFMVQPDRNSEAASTATSVWSDLSEGVRFIWSQPLIRANTLVTMLGPVALGASTPLLVGYAWDVLGGGELEYSLIGAGISVGSVLGGIWLSTKERVPTGPVVLIGLLFMGVSVLLTALVSNLWLAVPLIAISGFGSMMVLIPGVTLVQDHTPDQLLGRVFSLRATLLFTSIIVSTAVGGWAGDRFGTQQSLVVCGLVLISSVAVAAIIPSVRASSTEPGSTIKQDIDPIPE